MSTSKPPLRFIIIPPAVSKQAVAQVREGQAVQFPGVRFAAAPGQPAQTTRAAQRQAPRGTHGVVKPVLKVSSASKAFPVLAFRGFKKNGRPTSFADLSPSQSKAIAASIPNKGVSGIKVVKTSPADGSLLVSGKGLSIAKIKDKVDDGAKVFKEQWYRLERPAKPWRKMASQLTKPRVLTGFGITWTVTVTLDDAALTPLADVLVTVMLDSARGIGLEAVTDAGGQARFKLSKRTTRVEVVQADPLHGGWPVAIPQVDVHPAGLTLKVTPIELNASDARGMVYGKPVATSGQKVVVGVVDTGVGPHRSLKVAGGMNTTGEDEDDHGDEQGHGTHVAGVIASSAAGWRRGEACKVKLRAYRVFKSGMEEASTFDIGTAIKQAAADGCDLINLSVGGPPDGTIQDAIDLAWEAGCVCIAATGNDGKAEAAYPARYPRAVAISAIGLEQSWPAGANLEWTLSNAKGKLLAGLTTFFASFSNRSAKMDLTAPGVAIVSTIFGDRWGVMSGTSMATPIATGVLARRLAQNPRVLDMARTARRADAIVKLAGQQAEDLGLTVNRQGQGLAR